jgi:hypothetical protein
MNSTVIPEELSVAGKIQLFIKKLEGGQYRFTIPEAAHLWMKLCIQEIDDVYVSQIGVNMPQLEFFTNSVQYNVLYFITPHHVIFIHQNGAYGIYYKEHNHSDLVDIESYKTGKTWLVKVPNKNDLDLWEN